MNKTTLITTLAAALAVPALLLAGCGTEGACERSHGIVVCGDFGEPTFATRLGVGADQISWPPVAIQPDGIVLSRGDQLIRLDANGQVTVVDQANGQLDVPSGTASGALYVSAGSGTGASLRALQRDGNTSELLWTSNLSGQPAGTPPTMGDKDLYVATVAGNGGWSLGTPSLHQVDRGSGKVMRTIEGASPAAVMPDGSIRYLRDASGGGEDVTYGELVAEAADGTVLWSWAYGAGIVDYAPGVGNETYVVTADQKLVQVSDGGVTAWDFTPPCTDCNVAAAPTVTEDVVYFPVWEDAPEYAVDPLYAVGHDGDVRWVYDGFTTKTSRFSGDPVLGTFTGSQIYVESVQHHPSGRPVVAQDGTLFVATDGAVVALDSAGVETGRAVWDEGAGEVTAHSTGPFSGSGSWLNPGVTPSPVLAPNGTLYTWDGDAVRAFKTGRAASTTAWIAPFGGPGNDGRVGSN
mgnify:CR=1 FL=1